MDPVVQVAIISVFATLVTTAGVVAVAVINKKGGKERDDILGRLVSMAAENQRKEASIQKLHAQLGESRRRITFLEQVIEEQKKGTTHERHHWGPRAPHDAQ